MMESLRNYDHLLSCVNVIKKSSPILKRYLSFILNNDSVLTPDLNVLEEQANDLSKYLKTKFFFKKSCFFFL